MASAATVAPVSPVKAPGETVRETIERFLASSGEPLLTEDGEGLFSLQTGSYALEETSGRLTIQAWNETRTLARRVTGIESEGRGLLTLSVERFGKRAGVLTLIDAARPSTKQHHRESTRLEVRETFRRFLHRWYPEYQLAELTTGALLNESLSPNFPRAFLRRGSEGWAAIAAPDDPLLADRALTFGLIWLDYLRRREKSRGKASTKGRTKGSSRECLVRGLILYLPAGSERTTCLRLRYLDPGAADYRVWSYTSEGLDFPLDLADYGNLDTEVEPCRGLSDTPSRAFGPGYPELMLESQVRASLTKIDPALLTGPVYGQVPAFAATSHGLIDLLAVDSSGRLNVIELKASEDIHLPLQALDYWMRVRWHLERGDFSRAGYFPGVELRREPPRLLLVAPALLFHPANEAVLRYFSHSVPVERIGVGIEWQKSLQVLFRASSPCR
jgi:hypothetical protein